MKQSVQPAAVKEQQGFILLTTVIISFFVLTAAAVWMQKSAVSSAIAGQMLQQKADYILINSLIPDIKKQIQLLSPEQLDTADPSFIILQQPEGTYWHASRSPEKNGKIKLIFTHSDRINISYERIIHL